MYPKNKTGRVGSPTNQSDKDAEAKRTQKKGVICNLLIDKFRSRLKLNTLKERELEKEISNLIQERVMSNKVSSEKDLRELDKAVMELAKRIRPQINLDFEQNNSPMKQTQTTSVSPRASNANFPMMSNGLSKVSNARDSTAFEFNDLSPIKRAQGPVFSKAELNAKIEERMGNKGIGMDDAEWSKIVKQNLKKHERDQQELKRKKQQDQDTIREQLDAQIEQKRKMSIDQRRNEQILYKQQKEELEQKFDRDAYARSAQKMSIFRNGSKGIFHNSFDMAAQVKQRQIASEMRNQGEKAEIEKERKAIFDRIKQEEEKELQEKQQKRLVLMQLSEQDRREKMEFDKKNMQRGKIADLRYSPKNGEDIQDIFTNVFSPKMHQASIRRQKQDKIEQQIGEQFIVQNRNLQNYMQLSQKYEKEIIEQADQAQASKDLFKKQKRMEMRDVIAMQIQRNQQAKEMAKREDQMEGERQLQDQDLFKQESARIKNERRQKFQEHQRGVFEQIEDRSKLLRSIGSKVVVGQ